MQLDLENCNSKQQAIKYLKTIKLKNNFQYKIYQKKDDHSLYMKCLNQDGEKFYEGGCNKQLKPKNEGKLFKCKGQSYSFEGIFKEGKKYYGKQINEKNVYIGFFENNLPSGKGTLTFNNGEYYSGNFKEGKYHGQGIYISKNSDNQKIFHHGQWVDGKRNGEFRSVLMNGYEELEELEEKMKKNNDNNDCYKQKMIINYKMGYMQEILNFEGSLDQYGIQDNQLALVNLKKCIPKIKFNISNKNNKLGEEKLGIIKKQIKKESKVETRQQKKQQQQKIKFDEQFLEEVVEQKNFCNDNLPTCSICLDDIQKNEEITVFPCQGKHIFHYNCLSKWMDKKPSCCECRHNLQQSQKASDIYSDGINSYILLNNHNNSIQQECM